eukprot:TRINITY_DN3842_c0_g1_i1.p1 TRINITY_DN3842_c0_g1~~TRINITY_DN3842_c0_g1_i1.p1  ORF type:complete len:422 (-),score=71.80 TRINITY_DN3842_c0_g1_i1:439-1704(-)
MEVSHGRAFGRHSTHREKLVLILVGLPATGKTFMSQRIARYLNWIGVETKVFTVLEHRRSALGVKNKPFDPNDADFKIKRHETALYVFTELTKWLSEGNNGKVAIYDNTNATKKRRDELVSICVEKDFHYLFLESICDDENMILRNVENTLHGPDYQLLNSEQAKEDMERQKEWYSSNYNPLDDDLPYVKTYNMGTKLTSNNIGSYLQCRIVYFLMNVHLVPRPIWLTRHGQSVYNVENRIGGDSELTQEGVEYAKKLAAWVQERKETEITLYTSELKRTKQTAAFLNIPLNSLTTLNEIDSGDFDGMSYEEIEKQFPEEFAKRSDHKLVYRYPRGESYVDLIVRLEPFLFELERCKTPVLVIAHQAVIRCLYAYLMDKSPEDCPTIPINLGTIIEITPKAYGFTQKDYPLLPTKEQVHKI